MCKMTEGCTNPPIFGLKGCAACLVDSSDRLDRALGESMEFDAQAEAEYAEERIAFHRAKHPEWSYEQIIAEVEEERNGALDEADQFKGLWP
jgi:hypothetical protein